MFPSRFWNRTGVLDRIPLSSISGTVQFH
jgi:hypothetical protein